MASGGRKRKTLTTDEIERELLNSDSEDDLDELNGFSSADFEDESDSDEEISFRVPPRKLSKLLPNSTQGY